MLEIRPSEIIKRMINYFGQDVKRINHALKVYAFAKTIGESEGLSGDEQFILEVSAILHDIGIKVSERKYNSSSGKYQELEGPAVAGALLADLDLPNEIYNRILFLIGNHHSYSKIDLIDFQILVEADFLVNIYEDGIAYGKAYTIREKYFKTSTGIRILNEMYQ